VAHTLLLADDSVTIQRVIELTFADEDVAVTAVGDGRQAIDRLRTVRPDIVLADVGMPERDGYEVASFIVDSYRYEPDLMKVIIVEVTRAANSFGRTHLAKIREAYELIAGIVERAQADGTFRTTVTPQFAAMAFYGAIEQVLTGWIFGLLEENEREYERAKQFVVDTICGGLEAHSNGMPA